MKEILLRARVVSNKQVLLSSSGFRTPNIVKAVMLSAKGQKNGPLFSEMEITSPPPKRSRRCKRSTLYEEMPAQLWRDELHRSINFSLIAKYAIVKALSVSTWTRIKIDGWEVSLHWSQNSEMHYLP